ncbi:MAG TPA: hypothetical protein VEQ17_03320, partial [Steroidobacteraceae bacterium]|nr:hypothetical protein [Steroidobacteraceae bacterium]
MRRQVFVKSPGAVLIALAAACAAAAADPAQLVLESTIPLGKVSGRIDHLAVDLQRQRLYVAELGNDSVGVVDLGSRSLLRNLPGLREPQGVLFVAATDELYVANGGDGSLRAFRGSDLSASGLVSLGGDVDNLRLDPLGRFIAAGHDNGALALIDAPSHRRIADIPLRAHPEGFQLSADGRRAFVNVPGNREIAVIDMTLRKQIDSWRATDMKANFPLALEPHVAAPWVAFRDPAKIVRFGPGGIPTLVLDICGDSDDVFFDEQRHRLYVICGSGHIDVLERIGQQYTHVGRIATVPGARTGLFVPELDRLFIAARATPTQPAAILVFRPDKVALRP